MKRIFIRLLLFCAFIQIAKSQDLTVAGNVTVVAPNPVHVGITINVKFTVQNIGAVSTSNSITGIYISSTPSPSAGFLLSKISLEALPTGVSSNIEYYFPIPYTIGTSGSFYIIVKLNDGNGITETNYSNNIANTNINVNSNPWAAQNIPYPIIFIHGLNSNDFTWSNLINDIQNMYGLSFGGRMDFCLNQDGNLATSKLSTDYKDWTNIGNLNANDFFTVNFDVDTFGTPHDIDVESNQSGIVKQGLAIRDAIEHVLSITGKEKVILVGHSMGGLSAREYLQNPNLFQSSDGLKHVAKLVTVGTPNGGSNSTDFGVITDQSSEAIRDLRTGYSYSFYYPLGAPNPNVDAPGVYLFGGLENLSYMKDQFFADFNNADVNCDGITFGQAIGGLNQKSIPSDINYATIIGSGDPLGGDGVVSTNSANLNNYLAVSADTFNLPKTSGLATVWHTELTKQFNGIMRAIDEPNNYNNSHGYKINSGLLYYGCITYQSSNYPVKDFDNYKFNMPGTGILSLEVFNISTPAFSINIFNSSGTNVYTINSLGKSYLNIGATLPSGNYYVVLSGIPTVDSWKYPYAFKCTYTPSTTYCSGTTYLSSSSGTFSDGSGTSNYSNNSDCKWLIQPSGATDITLSFSAFNVNNLADTVFVYDGNTTASPVLAKFTGTSIPGNITSSGGKLLVHFSTDGANSAQGWTANYTSTVITTFCSGGNLLTSASGNFSDGSDTSNYSNYSQCSWLISPPNAYSITLNFTSFNTESINDIVNVYDGIDNSYPLIGTFSGSSIPSALTSTGGSMFIEFITNSNITSTGWYASYSSLVPNGNTGITEYQYWFDNDYGNAISFPIVSQTNLNLNTDLSTNGLTYGLHTLHIRFLDNNGAWSSVLSKFFYKPKSLPVGANKLTAYQYWFNNDYASHVDSIISPSQTNFTLFPSIPAIALPYGLHTLNIRFLDNNGAWSSVLSRFFYKPKILPLGSNKIATCQYWFDNDFASHVASIINPAQLNYTLSPSISASSLPNGLHTFNVRFQDNNGSWSSVLSKYFFKATLSQSGLYRMVNYRYWYDNNTAAMVNKPFTTPLTNQNLYDTLSTPGLSIGNHVIHLQFQDELTQWSSVLTDTFLIASCQINPAPFITGTDTICNGSFSLLNAGNGYSSYHWSTSATSQTISPTIGGTYTVTVTNSAGCVGTASYLLTVINSPTPLITGNDSICFGLSSILDAGSGFSSYLWSTTDTTQTISANASNIYSVIVTGNNGCTGTSIFSLTVNPLPNVTISGNNNICIGDSATLDAGGGYLSYLWSTSAISQVIVTSAAGLYSVIITDNNGCSNTSNVTVAIQPLPSVTFTGLSATTCLNYSNITLTGNPQGGVFSGNGIIGNSFAPDSAGIGIHLITYAYTDSNGCANQFVDSILVDGCVSINEMENISSSLTISPNPTNTTTLISYNLPSNTMVNITLVDAVGKLVRNLVNNKNQNGSNSVFLQTSDLPSAVYFINIKMGENTTIKKLVVFK